MSDYDMSIHTNPDAKVWAEFFVKTRNESSDPSSFGNDVGLMTAWFANAMMAMHDHLMDAQAAVQADYASRILAAIDQPATREPVAVREADEALIHTQRATAKLLRKSREGYDPSWSDHMEEVADRLEALAAIDQPAVEITDETRLGLRNHIIDLVKRANSAEIAGDEAAFNGAIMSLDTALQAAINPKTAP